MLDSQESIVNEFDKLFDENGDKIKILVSAEKNCYPDPCYYYRKERNLIFPYLNSGGIIGYGNDLDELFNYLHIQMIGRDQVLSQKWYSSLCGNNAKIYIRS